MLVRFWITLLMPLVLRHEETCHIAFGTYNAELGRRKQSWDLNFCRTEYDLIKSGTSTNQETYNMMANTCWFFWHQTHIVDVNPSHVSSYPIRIWKCSSFTDLVAGQNNKQIWILVVKSCGIVSTMLIILPVVYSVQLCLEAKPDQHLSYCSLVNFMRSHLCIRWMRIFATDTWRTPNH